MKRIICITSLLIAFNNCGQKSTHVITGLEGKPMPSFNLLLTDSITELNTTNIPTGNPIVLFYFDPNCPYCRAQTKDITENMRFLHDVKFYFFSNYPMRLIREYSKNYELANYNNITIGKTYDTGFITYFKVIGVPYTAIYDKAKNLKVAFLGKVKINEIKEIAFN